MKVPYSWLTDWVEVPWEAPELGSRLTMAGFELDALELAAPPFSGVIVAEIISAGRHPQADKLQVCQVAVGQGEPVQIGAYTTADKVEGNKLILQREIIVADTLGKVEDYQKLKDFFGTVRSHDEDQALLSRNSAAKGN